MDHILQHFDELARAVWKLRQAQADYLKKARTENERACKRALVGVSNVFVTIRASRPTVHFLSNSCEQIAACMQNTELSPELKYTLDFWDVTCPACKLFLTKLIQNGLPDAIELEQIEQFPIKPGMTIEIGGESLKISNVINRGGYFEVRHNNGATSLSRAQAKEIKIVEHGKK